jgi:ligand-binding sensor domain-containing protein
MICQRVYLSLICFFLSFLLGALTPEKKLNQYIVHQWSAAEGLPGNSVVSMVQGTEGYLWIACKQEFCTFDGLKFTTHDIFEDNIQQFYEITDLKIDLSGYLWISTRAKGLVRYKNRRFKWYTTEKGLSKNSINRLFCDHRNRI